MKRSKVKLTMIAVALLSAIAVPCFGAGSMGISKGQDLDRLLGIAENIYDMSLQDAVILLRSEEVNITETGASSMRVHTAVWLGTSTAIRRYADLRIPWDSAESDLKVSILRTWRDDRWWPGEKDISPTAVVETLPFAVASADDYTSLRETMLLHDGIALPCVIETEWEITWKDGSGPGDDHFIFTQADPAVLAEFSLTVPEGYQAGYAGINGAPPPSVSTSEMRDTYRWRMERIAGIGSEAGEGSISWAPSVLWSVWNGWSEAGRVFSESMEKAAFADSLGRELSSRIERHDGAAASARAAADLVDDLTRSVDYDWRLSGIRPRDASRTYETAYGNRLDRAALAMAVFKRAGLKAEPVFLSAASGAASCAVPGFSCLAGPHIMVSGDGLKVFYDANSGKLFDLTLSDYDKAVWVPSSGKAPFLPKTSNADTSSYSVVFELKLSGDGHLKGHGWIEADGMFSPWWKMCGAEGEAAAHLKDVARSVFPEAELTGWNPQAFEPGEVSAGFDFEVQQSKKDRFGRTRLEIGEPLGGVGDIMPRGVHIESPRRDTPVLLPGPLSQTVRIEVDPGELSLFRLPEPVSLESQAGSFELTVSSAGDKITVERRLRIDSNRTAPEVWRDLRALLLEEMSASSRVMILE